MDIKTNSPPPSPPNFPTFNTGTNSQNSTSQKTGQVFNVTMEENDYELRRPSPLKGKKMLGKRAPSPTPIRSQDEKKSRSELPDRPSPPLGFEIPPDLKLDVNPLKIAPLAVRPPSRSNPSPSTPRAPSAPSPSPLTPRPPSRSNPSTPRAPSAFSPTSFWSRRSSFSSATPPPQTFAPIDEMEIDSPKDRS